MADNDSGAEQPEPRGVGLNEEGKSGDSPTPSAPPILWDSQHSTAYTWVVCPMCGMLTPQNQPHTICPDYVGLPHLAGGWECHSCGRRVSFGQSHCCGEIITQIGTPFKCPVCDGTGLVSRPPGVAVDQPEWTYCGTGPYFCRACSGGGVIWR